MTSARGAFGIVLAAALTISIQASATPTARLTLARGPGTAKCPDETFLRKAVAARLGYDPFFPWARKTVIIEIARTDAGFRGTAQIVDDQGVVLGERVLETKGADCVEPMTALGLAISIALDDLEDLTPPETPRPPSAPPAAPVGPTQPDPASPEEPSPAPHARSWPRELPFRILVAAGADGRVGVAPAPSLGGDLSVAVTGHHWMVGTDVFLDAPSSATVTGHVGVGARAWGTTVLGCARLEVPFLCMAATLTAFDAQAEGSLVFGHTGRGALLGVGLRGGAEFPATTWYFVRAEVGGDIHAVRPRVAVDGRSIYEVGLLSGGVGLSFGARLF